MLSDTESMKAVPLKSSGWDSIYGGKDCGTGLFSVWNRRER